MRPRIWCRRARSLRAARASAGCSRRPASTGWAFLFATQAPRALHNRIPGNAATQFYGRPSSPAQITAAREVARAKGGDVLDTSRLTRGQFYVWSEGAKFIKTATPLCLL
jgi:hypothetical protein